MSIAPCITAWHDKDFRLFGKQRANERFAGIMRDRVRLLSRFGPRILVDSYRFPSTINAIRGE
jgi:hypothetical protein